MLDFFKNISINEVILIFFCFCMVKILKVILFFLLIAFSFSLGVKFSDEFKDIMTEKVSNINPNEIAIPDKNVDSNNISNENNDINTGIGEVVFPVDNGLEANPDIPNNSTENVEILEGIPVDTTTTTTIVEPIIIEEISPTNSDGNNVLPVVHEVAPDISTNNSATVPIESVPQVPVESVVSTPLPSPVPTPVDNNNGVPNFVK
jgi:hypothetical protein